MIPEKKQKLSFIEKIKQQIPEEWAEFLKAYIQENFRNHFDEMTGNEDDPTDVSLS